MKSGAADYIAKPFDHDELVMLVDKVLREKQKERRTAALQTDVDQAFPVAGMIGKSAAMSEVCGRIQKVAPTEATVLIVGESGTGKELVARALHKQSKRCDAPFVAFNCAAVPEQSIEAELFGQNQPDHFRPGLIQSAEGGTLFLDEIGELPTAAQARLLRVLQGGGHDPDEAGEAAPMCAYWPRPTATCASWCRKTHFAATFIFACGWWSWPCRHCAIATTM